MQGSLGAVAPTRVSQPPINRCVHDMSRHPPDETTEPPVGPQKERSGISCGGDWPAGLGRVFRRAADDIQEHGPLHAVRSPRFGVSRLDRQVFGHVAVLLLAQGDAHQAGRTDLISACDTVIHGRRQPTLARLMRYPACEIAGQIAQIFAAMALQVLPTPRQCSTLAWLVAGRGSRRTRLVEGLGSWKELRRRSWAGDMPHAFFIQSRKAAGIGEAEAVTGSAQKTQSK